MEIRSYVSCYCKPLSEPGLPSHPSANLFRRREIHAWLFQLRREFPDQQFVIKEFSSGKSTYWNVVIEFNENNEEEKEQAFNVVDNLPFCWDEKARKFLKPDYFNYILRYSWKEDLDENHQESKETLSNPSKTTEEDQKHRYGSKPWNI